MSVGTPIDRIEGRLKVTGGADYASDRILDGMLYGVPVGSTIAAGRVLHVDADAALAVPGVVAVYDHHNFGTLHSHEKSSLSTGIVDEHRAPLSGDDVEYYGQYVALVIARTLESATEAAAPRPRDLCAQRGTQCTDHDRGGRARRREPPRRSRQSFRRVGNQSRSDVSYAGGDA